MSTPTPRTDTEITFTGAYTCTHHNDQQRAACPVCLVTALTAERDRNVSHRLEREKAEAERTDAIYQRACEVERELRAENATLRAAQKACEACDEPTAFEVRKLRAELATERARVKKLSESSNAQLSLICGELTASEFRTIRAVLGFILKNSEKNIEEVNEN